MFNHISLATFKTVQDSQQTKQQKIDNRIESQGEYKEVLKSSSIVSIVDFVDRSYAALLAIAFLKHEHALLVNLT